MSKYINHGVTLTSGQAKKIKHAYDSDCEVVIRLSKDNLSGNIKLPLTKSQVNKLQNSNNGVELRLSKTQIKHMEKTGGFLPLLALLPAILGAAGGLAGGITSAVNSSKQTSEQQRHNKEMEKLAKGGSNPKLISDKNLSNELRKLGIGNCSCKGLKGVTWGNGLYLERKGSGVFLERR